ncbi:MAG TPA: protein kinase [Bryobacteraceae bacterium]|nr:protein kinase [Bryobacteraceae bacterium]
MDAQEVRRLFFRAMEVEPAGRGALIAASGAPPEVQSAVLTLLRYDSDQETFLREAVLREVPRPVQNGERFGAYRLRELLGRGGMGAVFKGEREDGELRQTVAVKIVERGWLDAPAVERFRQERQILSGLVHPNIAQLLDGGTREDGIPYLVMEYVDGLRLDEYCAEHHLGIAARLRVFLPLCDAVEFAHRKLVVHRDLKPSNVLVTADGAPKLLDFGVAKAIDPGAGGRTQTVVLTPDFASPEQVLGREITTATDVYGLGAVLYHLLTGRPPHRVTDLSPREMERSICEVRPERPSALRRELAGDLENILLKALDPEPGRRYGSARELAEDISRYLDHRPVRATPYRWWYGAQRLVRRHRAGSIAACLAALAILTATGVSIQQARRAEHRFEQVRALANRFLFDFENSIHDVPATLEARRMVASTAREYLQSLAGDARGNAGLTRELAEAHYKLSRVEVSAGQSAAALADSEKAIAMLRAVGADRSAQPADRFLFIRALTDYARYRMSSHDVAGARPLSAEAVRNSRDWIGRAPAQVEAQQALIASLSTQGAVLEGAGELTAARKSAGEAADWAAVVVQRHPDDDTLAYEQARALQLLSHVSVSLHDGQGADASGGKAADILGRLVKRHPENARWRNMLAMAAGDQALGLDLLADKDPVYRARALDSARRAYALAQENAQRNPGSADEADTAFVLGQRLAEALNRSGRKAEAERAVREAGGIVDALLLRDPGNRRFQRMRLYNGALLGEMMMEHADWDDSARTLASTESLIEEYLRTDSKSAIALDLKVSVLADQAIVMRHLGRVGEARERCRNALEVAAVLIGRDPAMEHSMGDLDKARGLARQLGIADPSAPVGGAR